MAFLLHLYSTSIVLMLGYFLPLLQTTCSSSILMYRTEQAPVDCGTYLGDGLRAAYFITMHIA